MEQKFKNKKKIKVWAPLELSRILIAKAWAPLSSYEYESN